MDAVLGLPWLSKFNPVITYSEPRSVALTTNGFHVTLRPATQYTVDGLSVLSADQAYATLHYASDFVPVLLALRDAKDTHHEKQSPRPRSLHHAVPEGLPAHIRDSLHDVIVEFGPTLSGRPHADGRITDLPPETRPVGEGGDHQTGNEATQGRLNPALQLPVWSCSTIRPQEDAGRTVAKHRRNSGPAGGRPILQQA